MELTKGTTYILNNADMKRDKNKKAGKNLRFDKC
jgi:hypothetical protein